MRQAFGEGLRGAVRRIFCDGDERGEVLVPCRAKPSSRRNAGANLASRVSNLLRLLALTVLLAGATSSWADPGQSLVTRYTDNGDGTVTDAATGLVWMRCAMGQTWTGSTCSGWASAYTWDQANALTGSVSFAGHSDWRLPNIRELQSIVDRSTYAPAINSVAFPNTDSSFFWSASAYADGSYNAWNVYFYDGYANGLSKNGTDQARLVRAGQSFGLLNPARPDSDYVDHGDGTVTHTPTGLMWKRCAEGQTWSGTTCDGMASAFDWDQANALTGATNFAGYSDWHLPTEDELLSLVDYTIFIPSINSVAFPNTDWAYFWSASAYTLSSNYVWSGNFGNGGAYYYYKYDAGRARLVRAGQSLDPFVIAPAASRLDVLQKFTVTGTGFTGSTVLAIENCTPDATYVPSPANTATTLTFRCTPKLPGKQAVTVNGSASTATVTVDHPVRLGDSNSRGIPSVNSTSLWNGNVHLEATDLAVPGKGVSFALTRSYNSYSWAYEAARGSVSDAAPWRFNWDLKLGYVAGTSNKQLWVQREDGSGENFFKDSDTLWYPMDQGNFSTLKGDTPVAGQTTLLTREGLQYIFQNPDQGGLLLQILDHDGNGLTVTRDGSRVAKVTDASNRDYSFSYDSNGRLDKVTDFTGRYVQYTWETSTSPVSVRLKTVRDVRGQLSTYNYTLQSSALTANKPINQYLLTSIVDPRGNTARTYTYSDKVYGNWGAASVKDALNNTWSFVYCAKQSSTSKCSNGTLQVDPTAATSFETTVTPPLGASATTIARFDTAGRLTEHVDANAKTAKTTPMPLADLGSKNYNLAALPTKKQSALGVTGSYGTDYTYTDDKAGNLATQSNAEGASTARVWNAGSEAATLVAKNLHRVDTLTSATGAQTGFTYTATSGGLKTLTPPGLPATELTYDTAGQVTGVKDGLAHISTRDYDAHGNLTKATDPDSHFTQNTYDDLGRVLTTTDKRGAVTTNSWDAAGNLLSVTDALNGRTAYLYDANGNRTQTTDARNNVTNYTYDKLNRLLTTSRVVGGQTLTTTNTYDVLGRITAVTNANSHTSTTAYDPVGNVLTRANALTYTTQYQYDADNRVIKTIDPEGRVTDTTYDKVGRTKTVTTAAGTTSYDYDADGRLTHSTDPRGKTTGYAYDPAGRLTTLTDANNQTTGASYDANGNLLTVTDPNGHTTTYTYDTVNRPLTRTDANGQQWSTSYDANGNIKTQTVPGNKTTTTTYDALNRATQINYHDSSTVSFTYDANGNRLTMTDSTGTTTYTYDALDRMSSKIDPMGKTVSYTYDGVGNVKTLGYPAGQSVSYSYDAAERLTSLTDWLGKTTTYQLNRAGQVTAAVMGNNTRSTLSYDNAGRQISLINKKVDGSILSSHQLTLDANGNITQSTVQVPLQPSLPNVDRAFTYDSANRLATYNATPVSHDDAGRITSLAGASYNYNDRDQITTISGAQTASHAYNGDGHRVQRNIEGQVTRFVIDPNRSLPEVLAETDNAGNVLRNYVYGYGLVEQIDNTGTAKYYHFDPTGSTLALTNSAGTVTDSYAYTPYGETTVSGSTINPFRYVGKLGVMDDGNGLHYMRARYYKPEIARFLSLDALAGSINEPQTLNRYAYVTGNPVSEVDPSGLARHNPDMGKHHYIEGSDYQIVRNNKKNYNLTAGLVSGANKAAGLLSGTMAGMKNKAGNFKGMAPNVAKWNPATKAFSETGHVLKKYGTAATAIIEYGDAAVTAYDRYSRDSSIAQNGAVISSEIAAGGGRFLVKNTAGLAVKATEYACIAGSATYKLATSSDTSNYCDSYAEVSANFDADVDNTISGENLSDFINKYNPGSALYRWTH